MKYELLIFKLFHPFSTCTIFSEKLTFPRESQHFLAPDTHAYQGVKYISFPDNFVYVLNGSHEMNDIPLELLLISTIISGQ